MSRIGGLFSNAFNFCDFFSSGVDMRTGMYRLGVQIGMINGCGGQKINLKLGYDCFSDEDIGFGKGWKINLSRHNDSYLTLSNGSSYPLSIPLEGDNDILDITDGCKYLKPQNIKLSYCHGKLVVTHADGVQELFNEDGTLAFIIAPSGHTLTFSYADNRLQEIRDQTGKYLLFIYQRQSSGAVDSISIFDDFDDLSPKEKLGINLSESGMITSFKFPDNTSLTLRYQYINGFHVISDVVHPHDAIEKLYYSDDEIKFQPNGSPCGLPAVIQHSTSWEGDFEYDYSSANFLGFEKNDGYEFIENEENIFKRPSSYLYSCTKKHELREITHTYNKFHLLVEESLKYIETNMVVKKCLFRYYADVDKDFNDQQGQYSYPKELITFYYNSEGESRKEVVRYEYDCYGNELNYIDEYGIQTQSTYYPADVNGERAPAVMSGIPYLLKEKVVTPAINKMRGDEGSFKKSFFYSRFPALNGGDFPVLTREVMQVVKEGGALEGKYIIDYEYLNSKSFYTHGLLIKRIYNDGDLVTNLYAYQVDKNRIVTKCETIVTGIVEPLKESITTCLKTGKILAKIDHMGVQTVANYDEMGRIIEKKVHPDTQYEIITKYNYNTGENLEYSFMIISGRYGDVKKIYFDEVGREIGILSALDDSGVLYRVKDISYNNIGKESEVTLYENYGDSRGEIQINTTYYYDIWGEVCNEVSSSGVEKVTERDMVSNTKTEYWRGADGLETDKTVTFYNEQGSVVKTENMRGTDDRKFNGLGVCYNYVSNSGIGVDFRYDDVGRLEYATWNISEVFSIKKGYETNIRGDRVSALSANSKEIGSREYDFFGRVLRETKGSYVTKYTYETLSTKPSRVINPDGSYISYTLDPVLDLICKYETSDGYGGKIISHPTTGDIIVDGSYISGDSDYSLFFYKQYDHRGMLSSEDKFNREIKYKYSLQGALISADGYFDNREDRFYDQHGRLVKIKSSFCDVDITYDQFDQVSAYLITIEGGTSVSHHYTYGNELGRLIEISTLVNDTRFLSQHYEYLKDGSLHKKTVTQMSGQVTTEIYNYDDFSRLKLFKVDGPLAPRYLDKWPIRSQEFSYDYLGNIKSTKTVYLEKLAKKIDVSDYEYNADGMLVNILHSESKLNGVSLDYDLNGNLIRDERGYYYHYNALGQLVAINDSNGKVLITYSYNASGEQITQSTSNQEEMEFFYGSTGLINQRQGDAYSTFISHNEVPLMRTVTYGQVVSKTFLVCDSKKSVILEINDGEAEFLSYSPYGSGGGASISINRVNPIGAIKKNEVQYHFFDDETYDRYQFRIPLLDVSRESTIKNFHYFPEGKQLRGVVTKGTDITIHYFIFNDNTYGRYKWSSTVDMMEGIFNIEGNWGGWPKGIRPMAACNSPFEPKKGWIFFTYGMFGIYDFSSDKMDFIGNVSDSFGSIPRGVNICGAVNSPSLSTHIYLFFDNETFGLFSCKINNGTLLYTLPYVDFQRAFLDVDGNFPAF
ncbi:RHS repeat domain-containing protein [Aeromonas veronii]